MGKKNIYLVQFPFFNYGLVLPYSVGCLQAYCLQYPEIKDSYNFQPLIWDSRKPFSEIVDSITEPTVLGFSVYLWNLNKSLTLAKMVKERFPGTQIIFGGPSVPDNGEKFLRENSFVDILVHKEGEGSFHNILKAELGLGAIEDVPNITYRKRSGISKTELLGSSLKKITYPSPYLTGVFDPIVASNLNSGTPIVAIWETVRGCPYSCSFCDWGSYTAQRLRPFCNERLADELFWIGKNADEVYIADANFGILARDIDLAKKLSQHSKFINPNNKLHTVRVFYAKNSNNNVVEIAKILNDVKLSRSGVSISLQSTDAAVLKAIKRENIATETLFDLQKRFKSLNIPTLTELIVGLPEQTKNSFLSSLNDALEMDFSDINIFSLIKIPNASMFNTTQSVSQLKMKESVLIHSDQVGQTEKIEYVSETKNMSKEEITEVGDLATTIDTLHLRKWTYYISWFVKRELGDSLITFYQKIIDQAKRDEQTELSKLSRQHYIHVFNKGRFDNFVGNDSPGRIDWSNLFFNPSTFNWICLHENKSKFFKELKAILIDVYGPHPQWDELISFQETILLDSSYDPQKGVHKKYYHDWHSYFFKDQGELEKVDCEIHFLTKRIGRQNLLIEKNSPKSLYNMAGGFEKILDKSFCFIHSDISVSLAKV